MMCAIAIPRILLLEVRHLERTLLVIVRRQRRDFHEIDIVSVAAGAVLGHANEDISILNRWTTRSRKAEVGRDRAFRMGLEFSGQQIVRDEEFQAFLRSGEQIPMILVSKEGRAAILAF